MSFLGATGGSGAWSIRSTFAPVLGLWVIAAVLVGVQPGSSSTSNALAHLSAAQVQQRMRSAALAKRWVHIATTTTGSFAESQQQVAGPDAGVQTVTADGEVLTARVVDGHTYVSGSSAGLQQALNISPTAAARIGSRWVLLEPANSAYQDVTEGIVLPSVISELALTGTLTLLPATVRDGQKVIGIHGTSVENGQSFPATMWLTDGSAALPVEFDSTDSSSAATRTTFSQWGAAVTITRPTSAVPLS